MPIRVTVRPTCIASFPLAKIGVPEPTRVTFTVSDQDGVMLQEFTFVLTFDDPVPDASVPVVFNNSTTDAQTVTILCRSNVSQKEYEGRETVLSPQISVIEFEGAIAVFACFYK
jgi:hypothetical protein